MSDFLSRNLIDSRRLFYFYHVALNGSFSRAEAAVSAPQPVISRHINKLEEELGVQLLHRNGRGVTLTRFGEVLFRRAEGILEGMTGAIDEIALARRSPAGQVRIAAPATVMTLYMPEIIRRFMAELPDVEMVAIQALTGEIYGQLLADKVDVGVVIKVPNKARFEAVPLLVEPMMAIVARTHPLASKKSITRTEIAECRLVVPSLSHGLRELIDTYMAEGGVTATAHLHIDSVPLIREVVAQGELMTLLPESTCTLEFDRERFHQIVLEPTLTRSLYAAYLRDKDQPYVAVLIKHLTAVFAENVTKLEDKRRAA
jgi:DNA-binding transcriptional LysR family regulator